MSNADIPAEAFRALAGDQVKGLEQCDTLTGSQLANIDPEQYVNMQGSCVGQITPQAFASLSTEQLGELTKPALVRVSAQQLAALAPARCAAWADQDNFDHLPLSVCAGLSSECIAKMHREKISRYFVQTPQCRALLPRQAAASVASTVPAPAGAALHGPVHVESNPDSTGNNGAALRGAVRVESNPDSTGNNGAALRTAGRMEGEHNPDTRGAGAGTHVLGAARVESDPDTVTHSEVGRVRVEQPIGAGGNPDKIDLMRSRVSQVPDESRVDKSELMRARVAQNAAAASGNPDKIDLYRSRAVQTIDANSVNPDKVDLYRSRVAQIPDESAVDKSEPVRSRIAVTNADLTEDKRDVLRSRVVQPDATNPDRIDVGSDVLRTRVAQIPDESAADKAEDLHMTIATARAQAKAKLSAESYWGQIKAVLPVVAAAAAVAGVAGWGLAKLRRRREENAAGERESLIY
eukprot:TRINITY_DN851_c0_g1_i6.p2 TRINITY_DN851_c0_g1~~TRINITY_DN851_c0_g1_i6.p2  ORF type:complete len:505 (+),score=181.00 TRINITY_DN851_c0_g1_i6:124-1515(+)